MEKVIESVLAQDYKGPRAGFTKAHVLKALLTIAISGQVGRGKLGSLLALGQGEVRTMIKRLKETGLIMIEERGCVLTAEGKREYEKISRLIPWTSSVEAGSLRLGKFNWALNVRGKSGKIKRGIEQRDAAIKLGANGALTVIYSSGRFRIPPDEPAGNEDSSPWSKIRTFGVVEGDAVIITGADDILSAEYGALSAALTLL